MKLSLCAIILCLVATGTLCSQASFPIGCYNSIESGGIDLLAMDSILLVIDTSGECNALSSSTSIRLTDSTLEQIDRRAKSSGQTVSSTYSEFKTRVKWSKWANQATILQLGDSCVFSYFCKQLGDSLWLLPASSGEITFEFADRSTQVLNPSEVAKGLSLIACMAKPQISIEVSFVCSASSTEVRAMCRRKLKLLEKRRYQEVQKVMLAELPVNATIKAMRSNLSARDKGACVIEYEIK